MLKNIMLEITEKGLLGAQQPQILTLPDVPMLKVHKLQQHQKAKARLKHCQSINGDYLEKTRTCTQYLWAEEICLKISKSNMTNKWQLGGDHYHPDRIGCSYRPKEHASRMFEWNQAKNNLVAW